MSTPALLPTYPPFPFVLDRGLGDRVWDTEGREYIDFYGGHCVCSTGHCHPKVVKAIQDQAARLIFYSTAGEIEVRNRAAQALVDFAPENIASVFFCNSGAEANENALKIAVKQTGRTKLAGFVGGWHGRSVLDLSVTDDPKNRAGYEGFMGSTELLPHDDLPALLALDLSQYAAVILEPIQSMSGIRTVTTEWLALLREKCTEAGTYLIFDEIQTGIGRLGAPFAAQRYGVLPDLITCAKGVASGVPMGALLLSEEIASQCKSGDFGSTFGGGPIASAALIATLEVIQEEGLMDRATECFRTIAHGLDGTVVELVKGDGLLIGLNCGEHAANLKKHLFAKQILVGGSSDPEVLRLLPPLVLKDESIEALVKAVTEYQT